MDWVWIGVGISYLSALRARKRGSARPSSANVGLVNVYSFMRRNALRPRWGIGVV